MKITKQEFSTLKDKESIKIEMDQVREMANYYSYKGRKMIISGDTAFGQAIVSVNKEELKSQIEILQNNDALKYAAFIYEHWVIEETRDISQLHFDLLIHNMNMKAHGKPRELIALLKNPISTEIAEFLNPNNSMKRPLSHDQMLKLNTILFKYQKLLDPLIGSAVKFKKALMKQSFINFKAAQSEILQIQASLPHGVAVAYHYASSAGTIYSHIECFIIMQKMILKPCMNGLFDLIHEIPACFPLYCSPNDFQDFLFGKELCPHLQAGSDECATLAVWISNTLLKNNCRELNNSLTFCYYDRNSKLDAMMIPSVACLKISQSDAEIKLLTLMVNSNELSDVLTHKDKKFEVITIYGLLRNSINVSHSFGNVAMATANEQTLNLLPAFRQYWNENLPSVLSKRATMNDDDRNTYLAYKTHKYNTIANPA